MNKYFVYTGNAYPHKNLERLVKALSILNLNLKEKVVLKISCSRSVFTERLEKLIKLNNAQEFIELLGYIPDEKIESLYKNSIAFVFPTLSEGFGLPPMEAINAGTLVVQSDIPVLKEVYADSTFYFNPMDEKSIADALQKVLMIAKQERTSRIIYSQEFVSKYSWKKMAEETLKIYESSIK